MKYCHVENGTITFGPDVLPLSWRNVSGLPLSSSDELKVMGWLPSTINRETFDPITHILEQQPAVITSDSVTINYTAKALDVDTVNANLYSKWKRDMFNFKMSREMEEHYVNKHGGQTGDPYTQAILDAKVERRGQRP